MSSDGQAQYIQLPNAEGGSELFQISNEPPAELLDQSEPLKVEDELQVPTDALEGSIIEAKNEMAESGVPDQVKLHQTSPLKITHHCANEMSRYSVVLVCCG